MPLLRLIAQKFAAAGVTILAVSAVLFMAIEVLPGDAAAAMLGGNTTIDQLEAQRAEWGLDQPAATRYLDWLTAAIQGDLGTSFISGEAVTAEIAQPLWFTTILVAISAAVSLVLALLFGVLAGLRPGSRLDRMLSGSALVVVAVPQFVIAGLLVMLFSLTLGVLPAVSLVPIGGSPLDRPEILVLPAIALASFGIAWAGRLIRAAVADANAAPNVRAARLAGLPEPLVVWRHLLPATIPATAQVFAWLISGLFGSTTVIERVFNYPGLSEVLISAVRNHDLAVLEGVGILLAMIIVVAFLLADLIGTLADPKRRVRPS